MDLPPLKSSDDEREDKRKRKESIYEELVFLREDLVSRKRQIVVLCVSLEAELRKDTALQSSKMHSSRVRESQQKSLFQEWVIYKIV